MDWQIVSSSLKSKGNSKVSKEPGSSCAEAQLRGESLGDLRSGSMGVAPQPTAKSTNFFLILCAAIAAMFTLSGSQWCLRELMIPLRTRRLSTGFFSAGNHASASHTPPIRMQFHVRRTSPTSTTALTVCGMGIDRDVFNKKTAKLSRFARLRQPEHLRCLSKGAAMATAEVRQPRSTLFVWRIVCVAQGTSVSSNSQQKLDSLRKILKDKKLDAYIVPTADPHQVNDCDIWFFWLYTNRVNTLQTALQGKPFS